MSARPEKRAAIVGAAQGAFLEAGYGAASMEAIAARAGVSKQTLYNHFGSKDDLFGAVIRDRCHELMQTLRSEQGPTGAPEFVLHELALAFAKKMLAPDTLALYRTLVEESGRSPELTRIYYESGPDFAVRTLADYLRAQTRAGVLCVDKPRIAAEQFFAMLAAHLRLKALLGLERRPSARKVTACVDNAIKIFLRGVAP
jgi:TetR/AcrR family transcriptional repressor of mexJK operon